MIHRSPYIVLLIVGLNVCSLSQHIDSFPKGSFYNAVFHIKQDIDTSLTLPNQFIFYGSEKVLLDSILLENGIDYTLNPRFGILHINHSTIKSSAQDTSTHTLSIIYQALPFIFQQSYQHRVPVVRIDTITGEKIKYSRPTTPFVFDDFFGSNLQKSGSIVRGFTIGTNRDLSLNSGFRMQMSGNITNDIELVAALTDENTPIQPEGTTQTLQEVDKVFVELRGSEFSATLGDFNLNLSGNEFGNLNRKLQGAKGSMNYRFGKIGGEVLVSGAAAKGKFTTNQFLGLDGVQGPYRLIGQNNNQSIIVIAGSERVYINGERMARGENADYTIDYSTSEVSFTPRRLINRASRIVVDFEYSDRQFNRNFFATKGSTNLFNNKWQFDAMFVREGDNESSPIDILLTDSDKVILRNAGGDQFKAVRSGIELVGAGKGQYIGYDSLVSTQSSTDSLFKIYKFLPQDTINAIYTIFFSYVGIGNGSYRKVVIGQYEFVGIKKGSYEPIRFLPMPQSHAFTDFDMKGKITDNLQLTAEYALASFDANRFSFLKDKYRNDRAVKLLLQFSPKDIRIGSTNMGALDINLKERFIGRQFVPLDRTNDIEFNRLWNADDSTHADEELREGSLAYQPVQALTFTGGIGWMKRSTLFSSDRSSLSVKLNAEKLPKLDYVFEKIKSRSKYLDLDGDWIRQRGEVRHNVGMVVPHFQFSNENLSNRGHTLDTLRPGSYRFTEIIPGVTFGNNENFSFNADLAWRWDDSVALGTLQRASKIFTQSYRAELKEWQSISSNLDFIIQNRKFTDIFKQRKNQDIETILLRWQARMNPFDRGVESDLFYEVATERSAKLERVFQRVPKGTGNYVYLGDVNSNHVVDQSDFQLSRFDGDYISFTVPADELIPVINLKVSTRFRMNAEKIFTEDNWLSKAFSTVSSETYYRVEEKSTEEDRRQIYLLHFRHFLSDHTTLSGSNLFTQDINFLENNTAFSLRLRYSQREGLTQYSLSNERSNLRERSIRLRWQLVQEIANQVDYINKKDILVPNQKNNRERYVQSNALITDWSYRPKQQLEVGFKFNVERSSNYDTTIADMNNQSVRVVYSIQERGETRMEFTREEVTLSRTGIFEPFELTNGKLQGKTWLWRLSFDYRITKFMQATLNYEGRSESGRLPVHIGKAEVRAFF